MLGRLGARADEAGRDRRELTATSWRLAGTAGGLRGTAPRRGGLRQRRWEHQALAAASLPTACVALGRGALLSEPQFPQMHSDRTGATSLQVLGLMGSSSNLCTSSPSAVGARKPALTTGSFYVAFLEENTVVSVDTST